MEMALGLGSGSSKSFTDLEETISESLTLKILFVDFLDSGEAFMFP